MNAPAFYKTALHIGLSLLFVFSCREMLSQETPSTVPPNIILIVADDLGWNDVGYHGSEILTPTLDSLAAEGLELNRFYAHPTCSPTRGAIMTGKSPLRLGLLTPFTKNNREGLPLREKILPAYLKEVGYQTHLIGKWHLGRFNKAHLPNQRGFDHFYGYLTGGIGHFNHVHGGGIDWQRNGQTVYEDGYVTHLLTQEAVKKIKEHKRDNPFFIEVSYSAPHLPNEAPEQAVKKYTHLPDPDRQLFAAMVSEVDAGVRQIYEALLAQDLLKNTLIWFLSDNGGTNEGIYPSYLKRLVSTSHRIFDPPFPNNFLEFTRIAIENSSGDNAPLKKGKGSVYEGGIRVPSFIYAPAFLKSRKIDDRITVNDILPTILDMIAYSPQGELDIDGVSQWAFLQGWTGAPRVDFIAHGVFGDEAYLMDSLKLIIPEEGPLELYNVYHDPTETRNLASLPDQKEWISALRDKAHAFPRAESVHDPIWKMILDPDFFGGEVDRAPYAEIVGINRKPFPYGLVMGIAILMGAGFFLVRRRKAKRVRMGGQKKSG